MKWNNGELGFDGYKKSKVGNAILKEERIHHTMGNMHKTQIPFGFVRSPQGLHVDLSSTKT